MDDIYKIIMTAPLVAAVVQLILRIWGRGSFFNIIKTVATGAILGILGAIAPTLQKIEAVYFIPIVVIVIALIFLCLRIWGIGSFVYPIKIFITGILLFIFFACVSAFGKIGTLMFSSIILLTIITVWVGVHTANIWKIVLKSTISVFIFFITFNTFISVDYILGIFMLIPTAIIISLVWRSEHSDILKVIITSIILSIPIIVLASDSVSSSIFLIIPAICFAFTIWERFELKSSLQITATVIIIWLVLFMFFGTKFSEFDEKTKGIYSSMNQNIDNLIGDDIARLNTWLGHKDETMPMEDVVNEQEAETPILPSE
jgi:hypothetical protein